MNKIYDKSRNLELTTEVVNNSVQLKNNNGVTITVSLVDYVNNVKSGVFIQL